MRLIDDLHREIERAQASGHSPEGRIEALSVLFDEIRVLIAICEGHGNASTLQTQAGKQIAAFVEDLSRREPEERSRGLSTLETRLKDLAGNAATYRNDAELQLSAGPGNRNPNEQTGRPLGTRQLDPGETLASAATQLGPQWTSDAVHAALEDLSAGGVALDPSLETAETLVAVIRAANLTPEMDEPEREATADPPPVTELGEAYPNYVVTSAERKRWDYARAVAGKVMGDEGPAQVWQMTHALYQDASIAD